MIEIMLIVIMGYLGHGLEKWNRVSFSDVDLLKLASYTEGGLLIIIAYAILSSHLETKVRLHTLALLALAALGIGAGVTIAHIVEGLSK